MLPLLANKYEYASARQNMLNILNANVSRCVPLTPRTLGDHRSARLSRFSSSGPVLGDDAELVLLTFEQVGHVELVRRSFDLERDPTTSHVSAPLYDVAGDGRSAVGARRTPRQVARLARDVGHFWNAWNSR